MVVRGAKTDAAVGSDKGASIKILSREQNSAVTRGLDPRVHDAFPLAAILMDGRVKPGHDEWRNGA
jgi:hypothetical protein